MKFAYCSIFQNPAIPFILLFYSHWYIWYVILQEQLYTMHMSGFVVVGDSL